MMKLKPCPFCGGLPSWTMFNGGYILACGNPNCPAIVRVEDTTEKQASDKWNTRAEEPIERTAHWDINCNGYYPFCSACKATPKANNMSPFCPYCGAKMITREKD